MADSKYQIVAGIRIPPKFPSDCFREALAYKPKPEDVFIATYPKCGTTWMQYIVVHIFRGGRALDDPKDFRVLCPFVDAAGRKGIDAMPRPGAFKTHIPYPQMPYSTDAKYVFVVRNPKDCCVSLYHHTKSTVGFEYLEGHFDAFFEAFIAGEVQYNDYFDHLLAWYPLRNDKNVFYTTYEGLKRDVKSNVIRIADFLGEEYRRAIEKDNSVLNDIIRYSSFEYVKQNHVLCNPSAEPPARGRPKWDFIRKGSVGDWRNYFSREQSERMDEKFFDKTRGTEIRDWFPMDVLSF